MTPLKPSQHKAYSDSWLLFCPIRLEIIDYLAEEPSEWGISCIGSRGISGFLDATLLATPHPQTGETLASAIARMGGTPQAAERLRLAITNDTALGVMRYADAGYDIAQRKAASSQLHYFNIH